MAELGAIGSGMKGNGVAKFPIPSASRGAVFGVTCSRNLVPKNADSAQFNKAIPGITKQLSARRPACWLDWRPRGCCREQIMGLWQLTFHPATGRLLCAAFNSPENTRPRHSDACLS